MQLIPIDPKFVDFAWRDGAHKLGWEGNPVPQARKHCVKSGHCMQGCVYRAKQSQLVTHIPQAVALGARVYADVEARELVRENGKVRRLLARVVHRPSNRASANKGQTPKPRARTSPGQANAACNAASRLPS